jgi:DNA-directed RNA polymerase subunit M/transcription elongation factor TFIIS
MADNKGYTDTKEFICTGCGKTIMLTKFASQKTCKCDDCKANNIPINNEIVQQALGKNPPKERVKVETNGNDGATKDRPCIQCGKMATVSKFMSDKKVLCDECKGIDTNTSGQIPKLTVDLSKLDRSKIPPVEEYEVNQAVISNRRLREVKCPACGHEYMKPLSVIDWSQFGLIITYQCTECYLTMTISEQCNHLLKQFNPGLRFDYTGVQIEELGMSSKDHSRLANSVILLSEKLRENNIKLDNTQFPPYRWNNDKPVVTGFTIPEEDKWVHTISELANVLRSAPRTGSDVDDPEGTRNITISDTLAKELADKLENLLKEE